MKFGLSFKITAVLGALLSCISFCACSTRSNGEIAKKPHYPYVEGVVHKQASINNISMHLAEAGEGPLIILVHGFPELWYSWRRQFPSLTAAGYKVVAPDLRGFGDTGSLPNLEDYDVVDTCADLTGIMDYYGRNQAVIVGHDWGSAIAFYCAQIEPERFRALVTVSIPYGGSKSTLTPLERLQKAFGDNFFYMLYFQTDAAQYELEDRTAELFKKFFVSPGADRYPAKISNPLASAGGFLDRIGAPKNAPDWISPAEVQYFIETFEKTGFKSGLNYYRNLGRNWELLRDIGPKQMTNPALFISGEKEFAIQDRDIADMKSAMKEITPNVDIHLIPEGGHWIMDEKTEEFNRALIKFLDDLRKQ